MAETRYLYNSGSARIHLLAHLSWPKLFVYRLVCLDRDTKLILWLLMRYSIEVQFQSDFHVLILVDRQLFEQALVMRCTLNP